MATADQALIGQDIQPEAQAEQQQPEGYGDWNEQLPQELQDALVKLGQHFSEEFRFARRIEISKAYQARSFWRENQHLTWNLDAEAWDLLGPSGYSRADGGKADTAMLYSTNMYQGFGESFQAIITQAVPSLRFEPEDPDEAADIETAQASEPLRKIIQHENDPIKLMTKAAYYAWTDGRIHGWTRWEIDKRTEQPRETQSVHGVLEVKVPLIYEEQSEYLYLKYSNESHQATVRAKVARRNFEEPDYWKKIKGGISGNGQDTYERTARISIKQGISMKSAGGEAYAHLVTTDRFWMRPEAFYTDCVEEQYRGQLQSLFPSGCYLETDGGVYTGSKDCSMDDEWAVENIMEGDGAFRNGKGTCLVSLQERANDIINSTQDIYEKTLPASHWDDKVFDVDAMKRQRSTPGARYGVNWSELPAGDTLANHVFFEQAAQVSPDMLQYLKELMTDIPEFLTGISAILFGSDSGGDKSGKALSIQQAAAMGRIGLPFRVMKRFYAKMMEQAVRCAARNRKDDMSQGVPDQNGELETIQVRIEQLSGKVRCFPDSDENYPESWMQKRATYMQLLQEGNTDPAMRATLMKPKNQELGKKLIGLQDLEIAGADSWKKQMAEINLLLMEPPQPIQPPPQQVPNPLVPTQMETIQPPPKMASSIPIDPDFDDNAAEFQTIQDWINSAAGQKAKKTNPNFENVRLHGLEHKAAIPPPPMPMMPPPKAPPKPGAIAA